MHRIIAVHRQLIRAAVHALGGITVYRRLTRSGVRILMYHRFPDGGRGLREQCEHIRKHYAPVSLKQVADSYRTGEPLPANALAVTIDDGYRDFVTAGEPVFHEYGIPTTIFVVSDFLDGRQWMWWDALAYSLKHTRRRDITLDAGFRERMKTLPVEEREREVGAVLRELDVALPSAPPEEHAPMTWDDARRLSTRGVEFGAHTRTHPILSRISDRERLRDEILAPKARIEAELGLPALHFCYPNGRRQDFTDDAVALVRDVGFQTAVTTERGINYAGAPPFLLRRLGVDPGVPMPYFAELLAGVRAA